MVDRLATEVAGTAGAVNTVPAIGALMRCRSSPSVSARSRGGRTLPGRLFFFIALMRSDSPGRAVRTGSQGISRSHAPRRLWPLGYHCERLPEIARAELASAASRSARPLGVGGARPGRSSRHIPTASARCAAASSRFPCERRSRSGARSDIPTVRRAAFVLCRVARCAAASGGWVAMQNGVARVGAGFVVRRGPAVKAYPDDKRCGAAVRSGFPAKGCRARPAQSVVARACAACRAGRQSRHIPMTSAPAPLSARVSLRKAAALAGVSRAVPRGSPSCGWSRGTSVKAYPDDKRFGAAVRSGFPAKGWRARRRSSQRRLARGSTASDGASAFTGCRTCGGSVCRLSGAGVKASGASRRERRRQSVARDLRQSKVGHRVDSRADARHKLQRRYR